MTAFQFSSPPSLRRKLAGFARPLVVFVKDAGHGLLEVSHNSLALVGLAVVALCLFFANRADLRNTVEESAFGWLQTRHIARIDADDTPAGLARALADVDFGAVPIVATYPSAKRLRKSARRVLERLGTALRDALAA